MLFKAINPRLISICLIIASLNFQFLKGQTTPDPYAYLITEVFGIFNETDSSNRTNFPDGSQKPCNCVPMKDCHKYNNSIFYGEGLIDVRINQCPTSLDICCDEKNDPLAPKPTQPYARKIKCGLRNEAGVGFRISAGNMEAQFGEFPWMIAILALKEEEGREVARYHCGGSLIHPKVVLTAAHCVISFEKKPNKLILRAGEWDSKSESELLPYQERHGYKIIVHKEFRSGPLHNDIAVIILEESFEYAENVDITCLPNVNENVDYQKCVASGWGKDEFGEEGTYQNILKRVDLPIISREECQKRLLDTRLGPRYYLHESFLCAGGIAKQDTCKGDGGGPLMCPIPGNKDHYQQVGIISWGIGCGNNIPAMYTNIPYLRNWIDEQFIDNNLELIYHTEKYDIK